jgi:hypothetical protein
MMTNPPNNIIFQYVRNRRRQKVGIVLAMKRHDNKIGFGYSLCAKNLGDKFDPTKALDIAIGRAEVFPNFIDCVPQSVANDWATMFDRAERYFKDAEIA